MSKAIQETTVDGRRKRSERSCEAIISATLALMDEGVLVPTAQQVSDRAGIGIRSVFRHYEDMESLFAAADESIRSSYEMLFIGGDRTGTIQQRLEKSIKHRSKAYDSVSNLILGTKAQLWRYEALRKNYARNQRGLRKDLESWLPEIQSLPKAKREAIDSVTSFDTWNRLRETQGLSKSASVEIVVSLLSSLVIKNS